MSMANEPEHDIEDAITTQMRVILTAAARVGQTVAHEIERSMRAAQATSEQSAQETAGRLEVERHSARALVAPVGETQWWDNAAAEDIGRAWETVEAWQPYDAEVYDAGRLMVRECHNHYGLDIAMHGTTVEDIQAALDEAERRRAYEQSRAQEDEREARGLANEAAEADKRAGDAGDALDGAHGIDDPASREQRAREASTQLEDELALSSAATAEAGAVWDSVERREQMAADLSAVVDHPVAVEARLRADHSQARPPREAAQGGRRGAPKARKASSSQRGQQRMQERGV